MKKSLKIILGGLCILGGAIYLRIKYKKELELVEKETSSLRKEEIANKESVEEDSEEEDPKKEDCDKVGLKENNDRSVVRKIYKSIEFDENWDRDYIKIQPDGLSEGCLNADNIVHVKEFTDRIGERRLDFLFEIPDSAYKSDEFSRIPKVGDYIIKIKDFTNNFSKSRNIEFKSGIEGYYIISYKVHGVVDEFGSPKIFQEAVLIPRSDYQEYGNEGLTELIKSAVSSHRSKKITIRYHGRGYKSDDIYDLKLITSLLTYRVSFPIRGTKRDIKKASIEELNALEKPNVELARDYLGEVIEKLVIYRGKVLSNAVIYNHLMFHSKNPNFPNNGHDLMWYYTVTTEDFRDPGFGKREIISEEIEYK